MATVQSDLACTLPPIHRLPFDILSEIFLQNLPPFEPPEKISHTTVPLNVSAVCTGWRQVALSCSLLWAFVYVEDRRISPREFRRYMSRVDLFLGRSGSSPLNIRLVLGQSREHYSEREWPAESILERVMVHSARFRNVKIEVVLPHTRRDVPVFLDIDANKMPFLETLEIDVDFTRQGRRPTCDICLSPSSLLRRLKLNGYLNVRTPEIPMSPMTSLTHLSLGWHLKERGQTKKSFFDVILACPSITSLKVIIGDGSSPERRYFDVVTLPHLTHLELCYSSNFNSRRNQVDDFLDQIHAPALVYLAINVSECLYRPQHIETFLQRSQPALKHLECHYSLLKEDALAILYLLPQLVVLSAEVGSWIMEILTLHPTGRNICPHLKSIIFKNYSTNNYDSQIEALARMLASRRRVDLPCSGGSVLEEVTLQTIPLPHDKFFNHPEIKRCLSEGLVLNIK